MDKLITITRISISLLIIFILANPTLAALESDKKPNKIGRAHV